MPDNPRLMIQRARREISLGKPEAASQLLGALAAARPGDIEVQTLLAMVHAELGEPEAAQESVRQVVELSGGADAAHVLEAQVLLSAGRIDGAHQVLDRVSGKNGRNRNIVAEGLRTVLNLFVRSAGPPPIETISRAELEAALPRHVLWFEPVLSVLCLLLEQHLATRELTPRVHAARTVLVQPDLGPGAFRPPNRGPLERLLDLLRSKASLERKRRELDVVRHFHAGDHTAAAQALKRWLNDSPAAFSRERSGIDPRQLLLLEVLFSSCRYTDYIEFWGESRAETWARDGSSLFLLMTYALLVGGKSSRASRTLERAGPTNGSPPGVGVAHLHALLEIQRGRPGRALAWFRRAFAADDIAMVNLAHHQLGLFTD